MGYEAQQQIPFPIDQIQYSYQELSDTPEGDKEVLLVAIKKDVLDNLNSQVESNGLKTKAVDCSITSLYNAYRANHPEETEPVMILDIGAKTTDILFSENGRFFTRSVTAAGAFITNAVSREFKMSYRDAEQFKVTKGMVSLGNGHTDNMEADEASLATCIRNAMNRLCPRCSAPSRTTAPSTTATRPPRCTSAAAARACPTWWNSCRPRSTCPWST